VPELELKLCKVVCPRILVHSSHLHIDPAGTYISRADTRLADSHRFHFSSSAEHEPLGELLAAFVRQKLPISQTQAGGVMM
jgi:hypothetical protein